MYTINVNGTNYNVNADGNTPLLWVLRDILGLTGTKYGCGIEFCGACTVLIDGGAERSCSDDCALSRCVGRKITTIEGLSPNSTHPLQLAWIAHQVPQCGYCQSGMIMTNAGGGDSNLCVCGTYQRISQALQSVKGSGGGSGSGKGN